MSWFTTVILVIVAMILTVHTVDSTTTPKYCTATRAVKQLYYTQYCYTRWWWWWWGSRTYCYRQCRYRIVQQAYQKCCDGYGGTRCNVPICSPRCQNRGVCVAPNRCDCPNRFGGSTCGTVKCSWFKDCYPGVCNTASVQCSCSAEFDGPNCQTMKEGPIFPECRVALLDKSKGKDQVLETANCSLFDDLPDYSNKRDFTHIQLNWTTSYRKQEDITPFPREGYLRTFRVGAVETHAQILLKNIVGGTAMDENVQCHSAGNWKNPQETIVCTKEFAFLEAVKHKSQLEIIAHGTTGGFKDVRNQDSEAGYRQLQFTGRPGSIKAAFRFDTKPPVHCTEDSSCEVDGIQPIVIDEDITKTPNVTLTFTGWDDVDSGLRGYKYYVYSLNPVVEQLRTVLQNSSQPVLTREYDLFGTEPNSAFTLPRPGMYSILGEVMDFAENKRYARAFVLYDDDSHGIEETNEPLRVTPGPEAQQIDKAFWLSDLSSLVTISWDGHYQNQFLTENNYDAEITPLHHHDLLDFTYGNISASGIRSLEGITEYQYAIVHRLQRESRKRRAIEPPTQWTDLPELASEVTVPLNRISGDGFTIWLKAQDQLRNELVDYFYIRADSSPPTILHTSNVFNKNVKRADVGGFFSSIDILTTDPEGGIFRIDFVLYDILGDPEVIMQSNQSGQTSEQDVSSCATLGQCTCTNQAECYANPQRVYINNCWFLQFMGVPTLFEATVVNRARLATNTSLHLGDIDGLSGIGEYPSANGLRLKDAFGYSAILNWYLPASCYAIRSIHLELTGGRGGGAQLSAGETEVELKDLVPYAEYTASLYLVYQGRQESERITLVFNTGEPPVDTTGAGLSSGAYIGIAVGVLLLLAIIVLVIVVVIRIRQKKTPVPRRMMTMKQNIVNRFSRRFGHDQPQNDYVDDPAPPPYPGTANRAYKQDELTLNVAYSSGPKLGDFEDDLYTYGELQTDPNAQWKHSNDKVTVGRVIHTGRFAEIKEGTLRDKDGVRKVAVKAVKNHTTDNDLLMKAKMNFMATAVPHHNNIVNFVGAITEGPILLLEHCEQSLKDWLNKVVKVTDEVEDNMINFATDLARGMQHLHGNGIIHRRLGARNVLLKHIPLMGRLVGKVHGFGPMKGEQTGDNVESEKERIPIKWMALEQLGIEKGQKRPYTEKTDVWSFGTTVWEIFSKGASPFAKNKSGDIRAMLERGVRLECPLHCNDELYENIMRVCWHKDPAERPTFEDITESMERLFHGAPDGEEYYDDNARPLDDMELYDGTAMA